MAKINQFFQTRPTQDRITDQDLFTTGGDRYLETGDLTYKKSGIQKQVFRAPLFATASNTVLDTRMINCQQTFRNELTEAKVIRRAPLNGSVSFNPAVSGYARNQPEGLISNEFVAVPPRYSQYTGKPTSLN
tara:strand:+ start:4540 stop:4935 length:396 start_codon:yes stop_codon:yes gene_type:complete